MTIEKSRLNSEVIPQFITSQKDILQAAECDVSVIKFEDKTIRIVNVYGEPWFIAKDICEVLGLSHSHMALNEHEKNTISLTYDNRGNPNYDVIAESGFYKLLAFSYKISTTDTFIHRFSNWVFEVIPSIRKTGSYGVPFASLNDHSRRKALYNKKASKRGKDLQACKGEKSRLIAEEAELWHKYQPQLPGVH
ncbi:antirepressor protein [Pectobacterium carotovorum subsp. carotovorum]|nr:BRO family protein [Pectobacterium carotovorum]MCL6365756.1 antirepressor protein [Pectobacterium carotovorum subsp. carotovorum]